jgi:hypothetical protein
MARPTGWASLRSACRRPAASSDRTFALRAIRFEPYTQAKLKRPLKGPFEFGAPDRIDSVATLPHPFGAPSASKIAARFCRTRLDPDATHQVNKKGPARGPFLFTGAPDRIRTCDPCLRRAVLYPAELRALCFGPAILAAFER